VSLAPHGYSNARAAAFFDELRDRLTPAPTIASVSLIQPQGGMAAGGRIVIDGLPRQFPSMVTYTAIDPDYFSTMGLRIVAGRDFTAADAALSPPPVIVSKSFGRQLAHGASPIGHRITESHSKIGQPPDVVEIVGVVPDIVTNVNIAEPLAIYYPRPEPTSRSRTIVLRASGDVDAAMHAATAAVKAVDPAVAPGALMTMEERLLRQLAPQQFGIVVLGVLGVIALLLMVLGTYVLAASMAAMRRREMGIRAALGATRAQLGRLVVTETARLVTAGLASGLVLVWLGADGIRSLLYRVEPLDPLTLIAVAAAILAVTLAVCLRPAIAAARIDLAGVLRED
jgi:hypothetical protein